MNVHISQREPHCGEITFRTRLSGFCRLAGLLNHVLHRRGALTTQRFIFFRIYLRDRRKLAECFRSEDGA